MGKLIRHALADRYAREEQRNGYKPLKPLNVGIIGGGLNSAVGAAHFSALGIDGLYRIAAGCFSRNNEINYATAARCGLPQSAVYISGGDLLKNAKELDAVILLLPIPLHYETLLCTINCNTRIICEKLLVLNLQEALNIRRALTDINRLTITYNYLGYPMIRELKELITSGRLGAIKHFEAKMPQESYILTRSTPQFWRLNEKDPPLIALDLLTHLHRIIEYLLEIKANELFCVQNSYGRFDSVIDDMRLLAHYDQNIGGSFWVSKSALGFRNGMEIAVYGGEASAIWRQENAEEIKIAYADGRRETIDRGSPLKIANAQRFSRFKAGHPSGYIEAFANLYGDIAKMIAGEKGAEITAIDSEVERMRFIETAALSAKSGKWEKI
ncbi:MAG: Gfo/Idh/MocA family oxidoreductase [Helicobacteraceae bacterium]|jgi:predicted dehydrogenase|nr:Gfo/Idh/MocA family oxidoreductase [Helicobacteraceae bacterium]